jgi:hypothetical protein
MREIKLKHECIIMPENDKIKSIDINFRDGNGWQRFEIHKNISVIDIKINFLEYQRIQFESPDLLTNKEKV